MMENEKIVKALEDMYILGKFRREDVEHALVYIYTLQKENLDLKAENAEQTAKIERLKNGQAESARTAAEVLEQNIKLQKQVDELKKSQVVHIHIDDKLQKEYEYELKQTVKDTAKEIYLRVKNKSGAELSFLNDLALWIKERFGVAVEKWIKVDGVEVEL